MLHVPHWPERGVVRLEQIIPDPIPVTRATLHNWVKAGRFPAPIKLGSNVNWWDVTALRAWLTERQESGVRHG